MGYFLAVGRDGFAYPDTNLPQNNFGLYRSVKSNYNHRNCPSVKWEDIISKLPKDTLSIYFFNSDTLENQTWEEIRNKHIVLQRYDLSIHDIKHRGDIIEFPYDSTKGKLKVWTRKEGI
ncbi:MAG: hypothetical protein SNJ77_11205 [Cytophagales bacterium]